VGNRIEYITDRLLFGLNAPGELLLSLAGAFGKEFHGFREIGLKRVIHLNQGAIGLFDDLHHVLGGVHLELKVLGKVCDLGKGGAKGLGNLVVLEV